MKSVFRSAMFGFHKDDVANFIAAQSKQFEKRIAELEEEKQNVAKQFEEDRVALENLRESVASNDQIIAKIKALKDDLKKDKEAFDAVICQGREQAKEKEELVARLRLDLMVAEGFREKALKYDQLSAVLSSIVSANKPEEANSPETVPVSVPAEISPVFDQQDEIANRFEKRCEELMALLEQLQF